MKKILGAMCAAALLGPLAAAIPSSAEAAAPGGGQTTTIRPSHLERGPDVRGPHLEGRRVVDGDISLRVRGRNPALIGKAGDGYLLQVVLRGDRYRLVRVAPEREQRLLVDGAPVQVELSDDGTTMAVVARFRRRTTVTVNSAVDGTELASRGGFRGYAGLVDFDGDDVLLSSFERGSRTWSWREDVVTPVIAKPVYAADLGSDRMAYFTKDPYLGGCSAVTTITRPRAELWRSCEEAVQSFSPNGARIATQGILADGIGPNLLRERRVTGRTLATYRAPFFFGTIAWESPTELLLEVYGRTTGATVRCSGGSCERVSPIRATPVF